VPPDKFQHAGAEEDLERATSVTAQRKRGYKRGDLQERRSLDHYVTRRQSGAEAVGMQGGAIDAMTRISSLKRKKVSLATTLEDLKSSYTYTVLKTYKNPSLFIDELREQFNSRIIQLEKRTKKWGSMK